MDGNKYTEGIAGDGAAILMDGEPITIQQIIEDLNEAARVSERFQQVGDQVELMGERIVQVQVAGKFLQKEWNRVADVVNSDFDHSRTAKALGTQLLNEQRKTAKLEDENAQLNKENAKLDDDAIRLCAERDAARDQVSAEVVRGNKYLKEADKEIATLKATLGRVKEESSAAKAKLGWLHWRVKEVNDMGHTHIGTGEGEDWMCIGNCPGCKLDSILSTTPEVLANEDRNIEKPCADCSGTGNHFSDIGDEDLDDCSNCEGTGVVLASGEGE